jgi:FkbM family methyltransferase
MPFDIFPKTEVDFFNLIKDDVKIIFDVGSRDDIDYVKNSYDTSREFHLFEPVPEFIENCRKQIEQLNLSDDVENTIYLNSFGLGKEEGVMEYYPNTQSFVFRTHNTLSVKSDKSFPIRTISSYCKEKSISNIDFLKIDIEGMEIDVLEGGSDIIKDTCKIIQFEVGLCILDRGITPRTLIDWFDKDEFDMYVQRVEPRHPWYNSDMDILTPLSEDLFNYLTGMLNYGSNFVAIRKNISEKVYNKSLGKA